jgi:protocatechuate 3,4-dioxygenase beta subunit
VKPEQTEGPYFVDEKLNRSDIRSDPSDNSVKPGVPLQLAFRVSQISGGACTPLAGAQVDIWHCDASGIYSDVQDPNFGNSKGKKFLRGYQITDAQGMAKFTTIYPGWYQGRAVHIHFKIRTNPASNAGHVFTSQLYFDDALTDQVHTQAPYASRGQRTMRNEADGIYRNGGKQLMLTLAKQGDGYTSTFDISMQMS